MKTKTEPTHTPTPWTTDKSTGYEEAKLVTSFDLQTVIAETTIQADAEHGRY